MVQEFWQKAASHVMRRQGVNVGGYVQPSFAEMWSLNWGVYEGNSGQSWTKLVEFPYVDPRMASVVLLAFANNLR